jgi:hypothetical protein
MRRHHCPGYRRPLYSDADDCILVEGLGLESTSYEVDLEYGLMPGSAHKRRTVEFVSAARY